MSALHGKNARIWFGAASTTVPPQDLTTYLKEYSGSAKVDTAETSTFGAGAKTYVQGLSDATLSCSGLYDGTANAVDDVFQRAVGAAGDAGVIISPSGDLTKAVRVLGGAVIETSYQVSGSIGDAVTVSAEFQSDSGFRSGVSLAGGPGGTNGGMVAKTVTAAGADLVGVQDLSTGTSSNGLLGILMVTANTIATKTVFAIQSAATEPTYTAHITFPDVLVNQVGVWTGVLAPGITINKFLRVNWTCTGAGSISFIAAAVRF